MRGLQDQHLRIASHAHSSAHVSGATGQHERI